jgi:hypothetical protein
MHVGDSLTLFGRTAQPAGDTETLYSMADWKNFICKIYTLDWLALSTDGNTLDANRSIGWRLGTTVLLGTNYYDST